MANRQELIRVIQARIESTFPGSVVSRRQPSYPDDEFDSNNTELLEAYMIPEAQYDQFSEFVLDLDEEIAEPNGFSIMVHDLTPEETREYRWEEYSAELQRRAAKKPAGAETPKKRVKSTNPDD